MNIEQLLEKYFEGETSSQEEKFLREYFCSSKVEERFIQYAPLFMYLKEEIIKSDENNQPDIIAFDNAKSNNVRTFNYKLFASIAAIIAVCFIMGISFLNINSYKGKSYAIIDGKYHTESEIVKNAFIASIQDIGENDIELFPGDDVNLKDIIGNDISEMKDMFE
ncbi:MAG: hypothetical protein Q4F97_04345 [Bacteroidales bacterium]|nr:hypothetical protein [Bacteroidales bacterium]